MAKEIISTPIGNLDVNLAGNTLLGLQFTDQAAPPLSQLSPSCQTIAKDLEYYFSNAKHTFITPLGLEGTDFQKKVWKALLTIPVGSKMTYGELASQLNTSARAIGNACRRNPIPIIVPCHRIVGKQGLVGYAGETQGSNIQTKAFLLQHEQEA